MLGVHSEPSPRRAPTGLAVGVSAVLGSERRRARPMCGIAGILYKERNDQQHEIGQALIGMLDGCQHRGPDSTGFALYHETNGERHLRLRFFVGEGEEARHHRRRASRRKLAELDAAVVEQRRRRHDRPLHRRLRRRPAGASPTTWSTSPRWPRSARASTSSRTSAARTTSTTSTTSRASRAPTASATCAWPRSPRSRPRPATPSGPPASPTSRSCTTARSRTTGRCAAASRSAASTSTPTTTPS